MFDWNTICGEFEIGKKTLLCSTAEFGFFVHSCFRDDLSTLILLLLLFIYFSHSLIHFFE